MAAMMSGCSKAAPVSSMTVTNTWLLAKARRSAGLTAAKSVAMPSPPLPRRPIGA
jgi:hypothetical protein